MDDEIFQDVGGHWAYEMIETLQKLPPEEVRLLLLEAQKLMLGMAPQALHNQAEHDLRDNRHIVLRMLVNPVVERLSTKASVEILELKRQLDEEEWFWRMME